MLVEHRVDDVHERLVRVEHSVPTGEEVPLEPALALVLRQHLHHPSSPGQMILGVAVEVVGVPLFRGHVIDRLEPVRRGLVRAEDPEVVGVESDHLGQVAAQLPGRLAEWQPTIGRRHGELGELWQT